MHQLNQKTEREKLVIEDGQLWRVISGTYKDNEIDVYRENEQCDYQCKYLYQTNFGYFFCIPGERVTNTYYSYYYGCYQDVDDWRRTDKHNMFISKDLSDEQRRIIEFYYPDFKYTLNKWHGTLEQTLDALRIWRNHPEVELLLAGKFTNIAFNKSFYRLTDKKKKEIIKFLLDNPKTNYCLSDVQTMIKYHVNVRNYKYYLNHNHIGYSMVLSYPEYNYLYKTNRLDEHSAHLYRDYKSMLKTSSHKYSDEYWLYPKDLDKAHKKLIEEEEQRKANEQKEKDIKYKAKINQYFKFASEIDGYTVYIPESLSDWNIQAKTLHQCIVANNYVQKIFDRENYILVFIRKNNKPIATAEIIGLDKKIGQFYGDETDHYNCKPSEEVRQVLNKWIDNFKFEVAS